MNAFVIRSRIRIRIKDSSNLQLLQQPSFTPLPICHCHSGFYQFRSVSLLLIEKKLRLHNEIKLRRVIYFADAVAHFNYI